MGHREIAFAILIYSIGALSTFGHLFRARNGLLIQDVIAIAAWPAWWIVTHGLWGTYEVICNAVWKTDERILLMLGIGIFTAGSFLVTHWGSCHDPAICVGVVMESVGVGFVPLNALYWVWVIASYV